MENTVMNIRSAALAAAVLLALAACDTKVNNPQSADAPAAASEAASEAPAPAASAQTLTSRDIINTKLRGVLDDATNKWGIKVNRVELQDITPPQSVLQAMEKQMQAERNKRATILTSEGDKQAQILQSEGDKAAMINKAEAAKQRAILNAEGEATARIRKAEAEAVAIEKITEAVGKSTNPANYLLAQKYIQMMQQLAEGDKTKTVFLPYEATNLLGSVGGIKELFKGE